MSESRRVHHSDWWATAGIVGATTLELLFREHFHRLLTEVPALLLLAAACVLLYTLVSSVGLWAEWRFCQPVLMKVGQALLVAGCASLLLSSQFRLPFGPRWQIASWILLTFALCEFARRLSVRSWQRLHWALSTASLLFVLSQPLLLATQAPQLNWPSWPGPAAVQGEPPVKSAQFFLLLDELGAGAVDPIVAALESRQVPRRVLAIGTVGSNTAQVVPAMFSGGDFRNAKPCGWSSICGSSDVLDFSRIAASRDDVDVVGFYMPYCAIRGLRFCRRAVITAPPVEWRLWGCALLRRLRYFPYGVERPCAQAQRQKWKRLVDDVESALWEAPIWKSGGFLFAHVPLPHPPGIGKATTSLQDDYVANVEVAARLIGRMVDRIRAEKLASFSLVVFSDHSLRPAVWCRNPMYDNQSCAVDNRLTDARVPLVVGGDVLPPTDRVYSNKDVFSLVPPIAGTETRGVHMPPAGSSPR